MYVYYLTRAFNLLTCGFNLLARAFSIANRVLVSELVDLNS